MRSEDFRADKGRPFTAPNDLAADAKGGVYFTASGSGSIPGKIYYRGADRHVVEVASDIQNAKGVVVSLDGKRLYLGESGRRRLLVFDISATGALAISASSSGSTTSCPARDRPSSFRTAYASMRTATSLSRCTAVAASQ